MLQAERAKRQRAGEGVDRRRFLSGAAMLPVGLAARRAAASAPAARRDPRGGGPGSLTLFLCGDVMTGRGIDQALPRSVDPRLQEPYVKSARTYVRLAEEASGEIPEPIGDEYAWGDALAELGRVDPAARIVNLETAVTTRDEAWPGKGIHYRMHPANVAVLEAARIDCCVLANNHVLDWGRAGLEETLTSLRAAGMRTAGAGPDADAARAPAVLPVSARGPDGAAHASEGGGAGRGRVLVFGLGSPTSGIPPDWAADDGRSGVALLPDLTEETAARVAERILGERREGDVVVASIHWGGNWGYAVPAEQRAFARRLVDAGAADVVHGHSSHHPKGMEVHAGRLILYGCGDFLNDYEGIGGREEYRSELVLMYFPRLDAASGRLLRLEMAPMRVRRFRLQRASAEEARWLASRLDRESRKLGARVEPAGDRRLVLEPAA